MSNGKWLRRMRRPLRDFMLSLTVIMLLYALGGRDGTLLSQPAHAHYLAAPEAAHLLARGAEIVPPSHDPTGFLFLAVVLSALIAMNLCFARHVRQVAAISRRR